MDATRAHLLLRLVHTRAKTSCVPRLLLDYTVRKIGEGFRVLRPNPGRGLMCVVCSVAQSCLNLGDPMDCSPPGSSVHGILQARTLEWVAMPSSRGSS